MFLIEAISLKIEVFCSSYSMYAAELSKQLSTIKLFFQSMLFVSFIPPDISDFRTILQN